MIRRLILDKTGPYSAYSIYSGDEPLMDPLSLPSMRITKSPKPATSARRGCPAYFPIQTIACGEVIAR